MYRMSKDAELTPAMIKAYIDTWAPERRRLNRLYEYYVGKHDILQRSSSDPAKPNNRIVNPYPSYIVDVYTGYFMGEPVTYACDDEALKDALDQINSYNDEAAEDAELAKDAGIFGRAVELVYTDEDAKLRFRKLPPQDCIPIYDDTLEADLLYLIRLYEETDILRSTVRRFAEVYSRDGVKTYRCDGAVVPVGDAAREHQFGMVPVVVYDNNEEQLGDFEPVLTLIDAYDKIQSDSVNDMEYFSDAYLVLQGLQGTEANDIAAMKRNRVMLLPEQGASAQWLVKDINDTYVENLKTRIDRSIHKFSKCPAMTDEDFAANASGVAMKYKLMGLETATSKKERAFKKGLQRRIELLTAVLNVQGGNYDYRSVEMTFTRNIPANLVEMADVITKVGNLLSQETQIGMLPIDVDPKAEMEKRQQEDEENLGMTFTDAYGPEVSEDGAYEINGFQ